MSNPIVIAHHLVWTCYGWWLPNDPRGSTSKFIRSEVVHDLGALHYGRKTFQPASRDIRTFYELARNRLKDELLELSEPDARAVAEAFDEVIVTHRYTCYACAIMPDQVHLVIRKHKHDAETMIVNFQEESRSRLRAGGTRAANHPVWGGPGWKVFLDHPDQVRRTIRYVELNPVKQRLPRQAWSFVTTYDGWPLHPGHSPNSPYAKWLREQGRYPYS